MGHQVYKNRDGKRLPSVTTILGNLGWNKDALMYWAWSEGIEGRNYRETSAKAADVGTISHLAIEASIKGEPFDLTALHLAEEEHALVVRCIGAWNTWREQSRLEILASEEPLVSEALQYGGCLDCVAAVCGRRSILDIKTGNSTYADHLLQIVAYGHLWEETHPGEPIEEYHLIRLGKLDGSFHHHCWSSSSLADAWLAFRAALQIHELAKRLKKQAA